MEEIAYPAGGTARLQSLVKKIKLLLFKVHPIPELAATPNSQNREYGAHKLLFRKIL